MNFAYIWTSVFFPEWNKKRWSCVWSTLPIFELQYSFLNGTERDEVMCINNQPFLCHGIYLVTTPMWLYWHHYYVILLLKIWDCPGICILHFIINCHRYYDRKASGPLNKVQIPLRLYKDFPDLNYHYPLLPSIYFICSLWNFFSSSLYPHTFNLVNPWNILRSQFISSINSAMKCTLILTPSLTLVELSAYSVTQNWKNEIFSLSISLLISHSFH